ncbi:MAG: thrombospondin type 3 repeat-containing protein [Verrucomicrobiales bacterium]
MTFKIPHTIRHLFLIFAAVSCTLATSRAGDVVWVAQEDSEAGAEYISLLESNGHDITQLFITSNTLVFPDDIDRMNEADLVIVSRKVGSGDYNTEDWNDLSAPLLLMSGYLSRANRWGWFDADTLVDSTPDAIIAEVPEHPLFEGISLEDGQTGPWHTAVDRGNSLTSDPVVNGGTLIATTDNGLVVAAEWPAETVAAGPRFFLGVGSREPDGGSIADAGKYNLTEAGARALLNAVAIFSEPSAVTDTDNDGVPDELDAFPNDPNETLDTDDDGIGNNADTDDDGDDVPDDEDAFPLDKTESADADKDGIGDNADPDRDNDGVENDLDLFPLDPTEWADTDSDGIGDNADDDADGNGIPDADEPKIVWVSQVEGDVGMEFLELLRNAGYAVEEYIGTSATLSASPEDRTLLNKAALVVFSRKIGSGDYNTEDWDQITAPMLVLSPYVLRANRWGWFDSDTLDGETPFAIIADMPEHPLFEGIPLDNNESETWYEEVDRGTSFMDAEVVNEGTLIASTDAGRVVAAEWPAGTVAEGVRFYLAMGSWEISGDPIDEAGKYNLTELGERALLNAVNIFVPIGNGAASFNIMSATLNADRTQVTLQWSSRAGESYSIDSSATLGNTSDWNERTDSVEATGTETSAPVTIEAGVSELYFRVRKQN